MDVFFSQVSAQYPVVAAGFGQYDFTVPEGVVPIGEPEPLPGNFTLSQNYPNPFNARTRIDFSLNSEADVKLSVYDVTGRLVATLVNRYLDAGNHSVHWQAGEIASGVYYYRLSTSEGSQTKRMVLLK